MAVKAYRCMNPECLAKKSDALFFADPVPGTLECPQCGLKDSDPKFGGLLQRMVIVHFDPPSRIPGFGLGVRACDPTKGINVKAVSTKKPSWHSGTGNTDAVTCPQCKETLEFKKAAAQTDEETPLAASPMGAAANRLEPIPRIVRSL